MTKMNFQDLHNGPTLANKDGVDVINCKQCGFAHVVPLPTTEDLISFYRDSFYTTEISDYFESAKADQEWLYSIYNDRYATFENLLAKNRRRILDVGCGPGFFLGAGKARDWTVLGLEPSPHAVQFATNQGANVVEGFFTKAVAASLPEQDVIHMSQVLEHVPNPGEMLSFSHDILSPGGLICISVPNDFNPLQQALLKAQNKQDASPWWVSPTHHLNYFNYASLSSLLDQNGFTEVHREASFPMEIFALMGDDYIAEPNLGPTIHGKRKAFELTLDKMGFNETKRHFFAALAQAGLGRLAIITAQKC